MRRTIQSGYAIRCDRTSMTSTDFLGSCPGQEQAASWIRIKDKKGNLLKAYKYDSTACNKIWYCPFINNKKPQNTAVTQTMQHASIINPFTAEFMKYYVLSLSITDSSSQRVKVWNILDTIIRNRSRCEAGAEIQHFQYLPQLEDAALISDETRWIGLGTGIGLEL